MPVLALNG
ncbi:Protein of unknown function [Streptococcus thermophilus]|nr:Protein of unknown function [Streptococcus thermophilus]